MLRTTSSGNRPINGPWDVRAVVGFEGLRTLKRDDVDACPGLQGAIGTHLFILADRERGDSKVEEVEYAECRGQ